MRHRTELADRLQINELAKAGQMDQQIAEVVGFSRWTVRKWWCRYRDQGRAGLESRLGRHQQGSLSSYPVYLRATVMALASSASRPGGQDLAG